MNTGVTTNKNMLGVMLLVISLGTVWRLVALFRARAQPNRGRQLLAQGVLLAFGIELLGMADSATSIACFALGSAIILATSLRRLRSRPARVHTLCLGIVLAGGLTIALRRHIYYNGCFGKKVESYRANGYLGGRDSCGAERDHRSWIREFLDQPLRGDFSA